MIEKLIKNDLSLKRWRYFKSKKRTIISCWLFAISCFFSFTAEIWSNSKPLYVSWKGQSYFPVFKNYHPSLFGREDIMVMDYRDLKLDANDSVLWPLIKWDPLESNKSIENYPGAPSKDNWFGTDDRGR